MRSVFSDEKKLSIAALSQTLGDVDDAVFEVLAVDIVNSHGTTLEAACAWNWRITFGNRHRDLKRTTVARTVLLDRVLAHYGPETKQARAELRQIVEAQLRQVWRDGRIGGVDEDADNRGIEPVQDELRALTPQTEAQRWLLSRALQVSGDIAESHWLMFARSEAGFPWPFLAILVAWLVMLFFTFGLQTPRNPTVFCIVFLCSLSVASAVFLIVDMQRPLSGYVQVSSAPLRDALEQLGR